MTKLSKKTDYKVAIVCDWLTNMGGAERVVYELHQMYPDAPIYTSSYDKKKMPLFKDANVKTSFIQRLPFGKKHQLWPVLRRLYFGSLKLKGYNLVLSSSGAEAKAVRAPDGLHINYCHTPTHYYWVRPEEYQLAKTAGSTLFRKVYKILLPSMKRWDKKVSARPDYMICNSKITQQRIKKFYKRDAEIVYPPIDTDRFGKHNFADRSGYVLTGRQVHYKKFDLAVGVFADLGLPLKVIGRGPENDNLRAIAGDNKNISFHTDLNDEELAVEVASAKAFLFPGVEDFGIVAAEAQAAGTPVVAIKDGGALDIVIDGKTGIFFDEQTPESLKKAIKKFEKTSFEHSEIKRYAQRFDIAQFKKDITRIVSKQLN